MQEALFIDLTGIARLDREETLWAQRDMVQQRLKMRVLKLVAGGGNVGDVGRDVRQMMRLGFDRLRRRIHGGFDTHRPRCNPTSSFTQSAAHRSGANRVSFDYKEANPAPTPKGM